MTWIILLGLYFVLATFSWLLRRTLAKDFLVHNRLIHAIFFVGFLLPTGLIMSLFFPNNLDVGGLNLVFLLVGSLIWPLANVLAFRANHKLDVGVYSVINNLGPIFTLAIALSLMGERISAIQGVGAALLILSGIIVALPLLHKNSKISNRDLFIGLLSVAVVGVAIAYERFMLTRIDFGAYLIYGWGSQIAWSVWLARKQLKNLPKVLGSPKLRTPVLLYGAVSALRGACFVSALSIAGAALVGPAANFLSVILVIAGYFVLREKDHLLNKLLAVIIGIAGLLLISS